jgi:hypothetical protein
MIEGTDRFGVPEALIIDVIRKHKGLIRSGCYVPTRDEVADASPERVHGWLLDWWWESPTELIPSDQQIAAAVEILKARPDADHPLIQALLANIP